MPPCLFVIEWLGILMWRGPWEQGFNQIWCKVHFIQSSLKPAIYDRWDWLVLVWDSLFFIGWVPGTHLWQIVTKSLEKVKVEIWCLPVLIKYPPIRKPAYSNEIRCTSITWLLQTFALVCQMGQLLGGCIVCLRPKV